jgi:hypothetical protein
MYRLKLFSSANVSNANHGLQSNRLEGVGLEHCCNAEEEGEIKPVDAGIWYCLRIMLGRWEKQTLSGFSTQTG